MTANVSLPIGADTLTVQVGTPFCAGHAEGVMFVAVVALVPPPVTVIATDAAPPGMPCGPRILPAAVAACGNGNVIAIGTCGDPVVAAGPGATVLPPPPPHAAKIAAERSSSALAVNPARGRITGGVFAGQGYRALSGYGTSLRVTLAVGDAVREGAM